MAEEEQKIQHVAAQDSEQMDTEQNKVDDMTPQQQLWHFAKRGDVDKLKSLGAAGYDINATDDGDEKKSEIYKSMNTAMHYAVMSGSLETVKIIYNLEAGLETQNKLGSTPLHLAASHGYFEIAKYLISVKASLEAVNKVQNKPLHCAVYAGHVDIVEYILSQLDDPKMALLEPNGVGMGAVKYTAHDEMKTLLRGYFPKTGSSPPDREEQKSDDPEVTTSNPTVVEEEASLQ